MKIKVCGNTDIGQVHLLDKLGVDYAGFIFYKQSPRYLGNKIAPDELREFPFSLKKTGVFVNADEETIMKAVENYGLDIVQLHGDETESFCKKISDHIKVIKAIRLSNNSINIDRTLKEYDEVCDYFLFDKANAGLYGGTGEKFNWNILEDVSIGKPFFLSGGINKNDVESLKHFKHPFFYGVDVNSRFEISPGIKDMTMAEEFVNQLKK